MPGDQLKTKKLQLHVTEQEFEKIYDLYQHSGKKTLSDFIRAMVLDEKKNNLIRNNVELIRHLDKSWPFMTVIENISANNTLF